MKKLLISMVVVVVVLPSIAFASIDANLKYGSRGGEVTELQEFLIDKGFLTGQASGNFFALTRKAVIAWQASAGLPATGFVGSMSRAKINEDLSTANALATSAEITETGATTTVSLISGCASTVGFSSTTGKPCSATSIINESSADLIKKQNGLLVEQLKIQQEQNKQLQAQNQGIQQSLSQIVQNTAPKTTVAATPVHIPTKELILDVKYLSPVRDINGFIETSVKDGENIYFINYLNEANLMFNMQYKIDDVIQKKYSINMSMDQKQVNDTTATRDQNCTNSNVAQCPPVYLSAVLNNLGWYTLTFEVDGITKTFRINVLPDPTGCTQTSNLDQCVANYLKNK